MSTRALASLVLLLGLLLAGSGYFAMKRLGYIDPPPDPSWTFVNPLLDLERGTRVLLRPAVAGAAGVRFWFGPTVTAPEAEMGVDPPEAFLPHIRLGVEQQINATAPFTFAGIQYLLLSQMGAMTPKEWLRSIEPVLERGDGGRSRLLLVATYGHQSGALVRYIHDPEDPQRRERGFGWIRHEMHAPEQPPDITFADPAGKVVPE